MTERRPDPTYLNSLTETKQQLHGNELVGLQDVEYTSLYWLFRLLPGTNPFAALVLAKRRFEYRHPDMVFTPLFSPALHKEMGKVGQVAEGLEGREIVLILNIMRYR